MPNVWNLFSLDFGSIFSHFETNFVLNIFPDEKTLRNLGSVHMIQHIIGELCNFIFF